MNIDVALARCVKSRVAQKHMYNAYSLVDFESETKIQTRRTEDGLSYEDMTVARISRVHS